MSNATIQVKASKFEAMLIQSALTNKGSDPPWVHSSVYLDIQPDRVDTIVSSGGGSVNTYCTFEEDYFDSLDGTTEAILDVQPTLDRLQVAADGGRTEFTFDGPEDGRLSETLEAQGALKMGVSLPASEKVLEKVPGELPTRWDEEERFLSPSGNAHQTFIDTTVEQVAKIIDAVGLDDNLDYFPITVADGEFSMNVGSADDFLSGELKGDVEGPDLQNWYGPGFEAAFEHTLSGDVQLQTTPGEEGGNPMAVVQDHQDKTIRHVLVEVNPA